MNPADSIQFEVKPENFKFDYLGDYANYLLTNHLQEFVTVGIRFCREVDLPMLRPLARLSEQELVNLSTESNKLILQSLKEENITDFITQNLRNWIDNKIEVIDKEDVAAEDLTLAFYIRRKTFAFFLDAYTKNVVLQKFIIAEVDRYTSQEELVTMNVYLQMQRSKYAAQ